MTVKELRDLLETFPPDHPVVVSIWMKYWVLKMKYWVIEDAYDNGAKSIITLGEETE